MEAHETERTAFSMEVLKGLRGIFPSFRLINSKLRIHLEIEKDKRAHVCHYVKNKQDEEGKSDLISLYSCLVNLLIFKPEVFISTFKFTFYVYSFSRVAVTNHHKLVALSNSNVYSLTVQKSKFNVTGLKSGLDSSSGSKGEFISSFPHLITYSVFGSLVQVTSPFFPLLPAYMSFFVWF